MVWSRVQGSETLFNPDLPHPHTVFVWHTLACAWPVFGSVSYVGECSGCADSFRYSATPQSLSMYLTASFLAS